MRVRNERRIAAWSAARRQTPNGNCFIMSLLDDAVAAVANNPAMRQQCQDLLGKIETQMQEALTIWQLHSEAPMEHDARRSVTTLVRPDAAKRLSDLHYHTRDAARTLMDLTGVPFIDTFDLCDELTIELAYRQLKLGETIAYVCVKAVENQQRRLQAVQRALRDLEQV